MATETEHISIPLHTIVSPDSHQRPKPRSASPIRPDPSARLGGGNEGHHISSEELTAAALPPVDRGFKAWSFIASAFVIETLVWGLGFTYGVFQEYYISNRTFGNASEAAIGAVGTTTLAIGYFECLVIILAAQHWPDKSSTVFIQALAYFPVSLYMSVYTASLGLPPSDGTSVLAVFNLASVTGTGLLLRWQIAFGHLCDIAPYSYVMIGSGVGAALSAYLLWGFAHSLQLIFAFVVIFGSLSGGFASVFPAASVQIAGSEDSVSNVIGCLSAIKGVAAIVGPLVAAALHRPQESTLKSAYSGYGFTQVTLF
ncbi:hypothetical protein FRC06_007856, partial [Ceratobasidium sp. 370]